MHLKFGEFSEQGLGVIAVQSGIITTGQGISNRNQTGKQLHVLYMSNANTFSWFD